ncbi:hypothetical protein [Longimicrobium sp.]|uniref:hypothetical protein n=1 Tax=Longimicrobium sp. TaxID=2029185 RepID=UPI002BA660C3|nr:hypothetical protein [Longimicrobium sp.]HSU13121.1 hypothetical protein [Longimicrobium sp.]
MRFLIFPGNKTGKMGEMMMPRLPREAVKIGRWDGGEDEVEMEMEIGTAKMEMEMEIGRRKMRLKSRLQRHAVRLRGLPLANIPAVSRDHCSDDQECAPGIIHAPG